MAPLLVLRRALTRAAGPCLSACGCYSPR